MNEMENKAICELETHIRDHRDRDGCFLWSSSLEGFIKSKLQKHDPEGWLEMLISEGILEEPILGRLRFTYKELKIGENMKNENKSSKEETKGEVSKTITNDETVPQDTKEPQGTTTNTDNGGNGLDADEKLTDASDVLTSSGKYDYPLLEEFLGDEPRKQGILKGIEIIEGKHGESPRLKINETVYRSSSSVILDECKQLLEKDLFPYRICVEKRHGKNGNVFHTLRGGTGE
jgi:hypothetical protein